MTRPDSFSLSVCFMCQEINLSSVCTCNPATQNSSLRCCDIDF